MQGSLSPLQLCLVTLASFPKGLSELNPCNCYLAMSKSQLQEVDRGDYISCTGLRADRPFGVYGQSISGSSNLDS